MRKALVIGIDYYRHVPKLFGCVNDAFSVKNVLERHSDGSLNFDVITLTATDADSAIDRNILREHVIKLFEGNPKIALFYFAGHGAIESTGGYLITSENKNGSDGFSLDELLKIVNSSKAQNKIVVLDSCHSGIAGTPSIIETGALLSEGVTILTSSDETQYSVEENGSGVFTSLFVDALNGAAANLVGDVTPGSVYAHVDQSLGPWDQRPVFKTNIKQFVSLREVQPPIALADLKRITALFPEPSHEFPLDPSYEPTSGVTVPENAEAFGVLQKYNHINIVKPIDEEHMYYAAMHYKSCRLTALGVHYWNLVHRNRL